MPLNYSAAHSSRIQKRSSKIPSLRRSASSPFATFRERKPVQRSRTKPEYPAGHDDDLFHRRLEDHSLITTLASDTPLRDVVQILEHAKANMFEPLPERGGFNSTRIAEILNFRRSLPVITTTAHVNALSASPTATEREISELMKADFLRKVVIPGRGTGGSSVGECLVLLPDLDEMLDRAEGVDNSLKGMLHYPRKWPRSTDAFTSSIPKANTEYATLARQPFALLILSPTFSPDEVSFLKRAGFVTSSVDRSSSESRICGSSDSASRAPTSISYVSRAASGSLAATGGEGAVIEAGGSLGLCRGKSQFGANDELPFSASRHQLALPNAGPYLRLLMEARSHLVSLIHKSKFREIPLYLLRERWDGGISSDDSASQRKKYRGEFAGVLPSRTKKWRQFWGLKFDWVLAEVVGAGLAELFETGSVGQAVRVV
ncbi:MAG: hypothetical protein Q9222_003739 [Ikaeria aurantiellina]